MASMDIPHPFDLTLTGTSVIEGRVLTIVIRKEFDSAGLNQEWAAGILADFPGMPATFHFFVFQPRDAGISLGMLAAAGVVAGIYPAWRAASLPIAGTLRKEAVA